MPTTRAHKRPGRPPLSTSKIPTSARILQVAAQLFMDEGYDAVSMDRVAKACEVTKAVVYYYFTSKPKLFTECMIRTMETIRQRTLDILNRPTSLNERLLTIMQIRLKIDTPLDFNAVMRTSQSVLAQDQIDQMHEAEQRLFDTIAAAFSDAMDQGEVRQMDGGLAARLYMSLLMLGKSELERMEPSHRDTDGMSEKMLELMWQGIGVPAARG